MELILLDYSEIEKLPFHDRYELYKYFEEAKVKTDPIEFFDNKVLLVNNNTVMQQNNKSKPDLRGTALEAFKKCILLEGVGINGVVRYNCN